MFYHLFITRNRGWAQRASDALAGNTDTQEALLPGNAPVLLRGFNVTEVDREQKHSASTARLVGTDGL